MSLHLMQPGPRRPVLICGFLRAGRHRRRERACWIAYAVVLTPETECCIRCNPALLRGGNERVPQRMRRDDLGDPGAAGSRADDPPGTVPVQLPPVCSQEQRPVGALADGQVDRPGRARRQRDGHHLAALAGHGQSPVPALEAQVLDAGAGGLRYPQPVQREQRDQCMIAWRPEQAGPAAYAGAGDGHRALARSHTPGIAGPLIHALTGNVRPRVARSGWTRFPSPGAPGVLGETVPAHHPVRAREPLRQDRQG